MDFLKKLNLNDSPAPSTGSSHPAGTSGQDIFNKLSGALSAHSQSTVHPKEEAHPKSHSKRDLLGKIGSALAPQPTAHTQPAHENKDKDKDKDILGKIGSVLAAHSSSPSPSPSTTTASSSQQTQKPGKEGGMLGSLIGSVVSGGGGGGGGSGGGKQEKQGGLGDKINSALGGGKKGEAKEDSLDKAIDFVQEHVLKQGQQKNETAIEQLKDKQIADAIRGGFKNITGKEFPGSSAHKK